MSVAWSMATRPEELLEQARAQAAEASRILEGLATSREVSVDALECELRLQIVWLTSAANKVREAAKQRAEIERVRAMMLRREGGGE